MHVKVRGQLCSVSCFFPVFSEFWRIQIEFRFLDLHGKNLLLLKHVSHKKCLLKSEKTSGCCQEQQNKRFITALLMRKHGLQLHSQHYSVLCLKSQHLGGRAQPGLHSVFQATSGCIIRPCLTQKKQEQKPNKKTPSMLPNTCFCLKTVVS